MGKSLLIIKNSCKLLGLIIFFINPLLYAEETTGKVAGVPVEYKPYIVLDNGDNKLYGISKQDGFLVNDTGHSTGPSSWIQQSQGLPLKKIYPFNQKIYHYLTSFNCCPGNPSRLAVTTASELYVSEDGGLSWENIPLGSPVSHADYLTAVALSAFDKNTFLVGSSFQAIYETRDRGKTWVSLADKLSFLYRGAGFYEEISTLAYSTAQPGEFILYS